MLGEWFEFMDPPMSDDDHVFEPNRFFKLGDTMIEQAKTGVKLKVADHKMDASCRVLVYEAKPLRPASGDPELQELLQKAIGRMVEDHGSLETARRLEVIVHKLTPLQDAAPGGEEPECIIVTGDPVSGFNHIGPFPDNEIANQYADDRLSDCDWWVIPLEKPGES